MFGNPAMQESKNLEHLSKKMQKGRACALRE